MNVLVYHIINYNGDNNLESQNEEKIIVAIKALIGYFKSRVSNHITHFLFLEEMSDNTRF